MQKRVKKTAETTNTKEKGLDMAAVLRDLGSVRLRSVERLVLNMFVSFKRR